MRPPRPATSASAPLESGEGRATAPPCPDENRLLDCAMDLLTPDARDEVLAHAAECSSCLVALELAREQAGPSTHGPVTPSTHEDGRSGREVAAVYRPGDKLSRFAILEQLGAGGMGVVYAAYDPELDRRVALKLLRHGGRAPSREARAMARLKHPNVLTVYELGEADGHSFLAMELVEGCTLRQWLSEEERTWSEVVRRFLDAGRGLAAAHAAGVVHGDFKPDNVLVDRNGRVAMSDFGLARLSDSDEPAPPVGAGTNGYRAPELEQRDAPVDARADQYAFCVALREALTGSREEVGRRGRAGLREGRVPARVWRVIERGTRRSPDERFASMRDLLRPLQRAVAPAWHGMARLAAAVVGIALCVVPLVERARREASCRTPASALGGVWDDGVRARLEQTFAAAGDGVAPQVLPDLLRELDHRASSWRESRTASCRATVVEQEQPTPVLHRRAECLDARREELRAFVALFLEGDPEVLRFSVEGVRRLAPASACADPEYVSSMQGPPDPELQPAWRAVRDRLLRASVLQHAGRVEASLWEVEQATSDAVALGYRPLLAWARLELGVALRRVGRYREAETAVWAALWDATAAKRDGSVAQAWLLLLDLVGRRQKDLERAAALEPAAIAAVERMADAQLGARLLSAQGALRLEEGNPAAAAALFAKARRFHAAHPAANPSDHLVVLQGLWASAREQGRAGDAEEAARASLALLGGEQRQNPQRVGALHQLARAVAAQGRHGEALEAMERASALARQLPQTPLGSAAHHAALGEVLIRAERWAEGCEHQLRAALLLEQVLGANHPEWAAQQVAAADCLLQVGDTAAAAAGLDRAEPTLRKAHRANSRALAELELTRARLWQTRGLWQRAAQAFQPLASPAPFASSWPASATLERGQTLIPLGKVDQALDALGVPAGQRARVRMELAHTSRSPETTGAATGPQPFASGPAAAR